MPYLKPALASLPLLLSACANTIVDPDYLTPITGGKTLRLAQDVAFVSEPRGSYKTQYRIEMRAGAYVAALSDRFGVYYQGPPSCMRRSLAATTLTQAPSPGWFDEGRFDCGVFIPTDKSQPAQIYRHAKDVPGAGTQGDSGAAVASIAAAVPGAGIVASAVGAALGAAIASSLSSKNGRYVVSETFDASLLRADEAPVK